MKNIHLMLIFIMLTGTIGFVQAAENGLTSKTEVAQEISRSEEITRLYVAMFKRAPDSGGLEYWVESDLDINKITISFFNQEETDLKYPPEMSVSEFIIAVYENLFNRKPDTGGLHYWANAIETGMHRSIFVLAVINGALGDDAVILKNKMIVGLAFAKADLDDYKSSICVISKISANAKSVEEALEAIERMVEGGPCIKPEPDPVPPPPIPPKPVLNKPPTANAGSNKSVEVGHSVSITGSGTDSDGSIVSYEWREDSTVLGNTATISYVPNTVGTHTLTLTVTDDDDATGTDTMTVTVTNIPPPPPVNNAPTANAGSNKSVEVGNSVSITGSGTDSDGTIVSYEWREGSNVLGNTATISYVPSTVGTHTLTLTVMDDDGAMGTDTMTVTATATPPPPPVNQAPTAQDLTVNAQGEETVSGTIVINDEDGDNSQLIVEVTTPPVHGSIVWNTQTGFTYTVTNGSFYNGNDEFEYKVKEPVAPGSLESAIKTVTIQAVIDS